MTYLYSLFEVAEVTINSISIVVLVVTIILLGYTLYTVRKSGMVDLVHDQHEIQNTLNNMRREMAEEIAAYHDELSVTRAALKDMEARSDFQYNELKKVRRESKEVLDVSYIMLAWIKDAVRRFEALKADPPALPRDILLFEEEYKGRFDFEDD